jgi:hypothetical protein
MGEVICAAVAGDLNARSSRTVALYRDIVRRLRERLADLGLKDRTRWQARSLPADGHLVIDAADGERIHVAWA